MTLARRRCAYVKCRRWFTPTHDSHKHHTRKCGTRAWNHLSRAERVARRATKQERHPKAQYVYDALKDARPGECPWGCEKPLPEGCKTCCRDRQCRTLYQRAYRQGLRDLERSKNPPRTQLCECGCGGSFRTRKKVGQHKYLPGHAPSYKRAPQPTFIGVVAKYRRAS